MFLSEFRKRWRMLWSLGNRGEKIAAQFLEKNGLVILDRNWRSKFGEIDLIAVKDRTLICVEVKSRRVSAFRTLLQSLQGDSPSDHPLPEFPAGMHPCDTDRYMVGIPLSSRSAYSPNLVPLVNPIDAISEKKRIKLGALFRAYQRERRTELKRLRIRHVRIDGVFVIFPKAARLRPRAQQIEWVRNIA